MKYIDADLLKKEIDHRIDILADVSIKCAKNDDMEMHNYYHGKAISLEELLPFIDSLQQEQPEVDLKKEIKEWVDLMVGATSPEQQDGDFISKEDYRSVIRQTALHFYELGQRTKYQQDREEFAKLKAKEWMNGYDEGYAKGLTKKQSQIDIESVKR